MSFLDKINRKVAEAKAETGAKPNPLLNRGAKPNPLAARKNPLLKPKTAEAPTEAKEEIVSIEETEVTEVVAEETKQKPKLPVKPATKIEKAEEPSQEAEAPVEEEAKETAKSIPEKTASKTAAPEKTSVKEEQEEAAEDDVVGVEEKTPEEPRQTKKSPTRRSSSKKNAEPSSSESTEFYAIPTSDVTTLEEALNAIKTPFVDTEWEAFKEEIQSDLSAIKIADDLNPGMLKVCIAELAIVREKIWTPLQDAKNEYERFTSKEPEGVIERIKRLNSVGGNNETERRRTGIMAVMNFETPAGNVNFYEVLDDVRARYNFLKAAMDTVKFKTDVLITMNGALKLEEKQL